MVEAEAPPAKSNQADSGMAKPPTIYRWRIIHLTDVPAKTLGYVDAPDAETAISRAVEEFKITNVQAQERLLAERSKASWAPRR
jgi:hypothetical protein